MIAKNFKTSFDFPITNKYNFSLIRQSAKIFKIKKKTNSSLIKTYRMDVGLLGGKAGLEFPFKPYGVRGVTGKAGVSGLGEPPIDVSGSVSER